MTKKIELTQEIVRELLDYDPETGLLFWKERDVKWFRDGKQSAIHNCKTWNSKYSKKEAFTNLGSGREGSKYKRGRILKQNHLSHRIIWLWWYGNFPENHIDHINGKCSDNRISNLRDVSNQENHKNSKLYSNSSSGVTGVYFHKASNKWVSQINVNYKNIHLGIFDRYEDAISSRKRAEEYNKFHINHGRIKID